MTFSLLHKERKFDPAYRVLEKQLVGSERVQEVYEQIEKPLITIVRPDGSTRGSY